MLMQVSNLLFILFLVVFIFALLGVEIWGGRYYDESAFGPSARVKAYGGYDVPSTRWHFENLPHALITTFLVVSGENWNDVYFSAFTALGGQYSGGAVAARL